MPLAPRRRVLVVTDRDALRRGLDAMRRIHAADARDWLFVEDVHDAFAALATRRFDVLLFDAEAVSHEECCGLLQRVADRGRLVESGASAAVVGLFDRPGAAELTDFVERGGEAVMPVRPLPTPAQFALIVETAVRCHRRRTAHELDGSRMWDLFENATVGVYRSTPDGKVLYVNPTLVRMLGYRDEGDLLAADIEADRIYEHPEERRIWRDRVEASGHVKGHETCWRRRDGTTLWVRESARAVRGPSGRVEYYEGVVEDITRYKQAEAELRGRSADLEAFAYAVSHDLRTPLVTMDYLISELRDELERGAVAKDLHDALDGGLDRLDRSVEVMDRITSALLELAQVDQELRFQRFAVKDLLTEVASRFQDDARRRNVKLVIRPTADAFHLWGAPVLLGQMMQNLVGNALKHTPAEGGVVRASASICPSRVGRGARLRLEVADNGPGVPVRDRERVFRIFERGDGQSDDQAAGTGIGLALARKIASRHDGTIRVEAAPEGGALFIVELPLAPEPTGHRRQAARAHRVAAAPPHENEAENLEGPERGAAELGARTGRETDRAASRRGTGDAAVGVSARQVPGLPWLGGREGSPDRRFGGQLY